MTRPQVTRNAKLCNVGQLRRKSVEGYAQHAAPHNGVSFGWMIQVSRNG